MSAAMAGTWLAARDDRPVAQQTARRLAWAAGLSVGAHAILLATSTPAPSSTPHAVTALVVRTITVARDTAAQAVDAPPARGAPQHAAAGPSPQSVAEAPPLPEARPQAGAVASARSRAERTPADRTPATAAGGDVGTPRPMEKGAERPLATSSGPIYHTVGELDPPPRPLQ